MIRSNRRNIQLTMGMGGIYSSNGTRIEDVELFPRQVEPYFIPGELSQTNTVSGNDMERMFGGNRRYYETQKYEIIPFGVSWRNGSSVHSIAIRSRGFSSFEMNRNWFDSDSEDIDQNNTYSRFLNEKYHVYHEVSFGFAREVTMFNRWQSGLNTLLIGLSPKFMIGGMHSDARFQSDYYRDNEIWQNTKYLEAKMTGNIDGFVSDFLETGEVGYSHYNNMKSSSNLDINGLGLGLDAGLTYIIPLGDDISLSPHIDAPLRKSLRFSIALTDVGMVRFQNEPRKWHSPEVVRSYEHLPENENHYSGKPGDFYSYLYDDMAERDAVEQLEEVDINSYDVYLPTELHIGTAFQYNRFVSLLDLNYRFNPSDFNPEGWWASLGTEIRLFQFLPLMGSIQFDPDRNISLGAGAGLDLGFLYFSGAMRLFAINNGRHDWYASSVSTLGLQIRF